jgi:hypothetical protein
MILDERTESDANTPRTRVAFRTRANLLSMISRIFIDFTIRIANGDSMPDKCAARL